MYYTHCYLFFALFILLNHILIINYGLNIYIKFLATIDTHFYRRHNISTSIHEFELCNILSYNIGRSFTTSPFVISCVKFKHHISKNKNSILRSFHHNILVVYAIIS